MESPSRDCVDIDECSGDNLCDVNAECYNEPGGYSCQCKYGYVGNGYECNLENSPASERLPQETYSSNNRDQNPNTQVFTYQFLPTSSDNRYEHSERHQENRDQYSPIPSNNDDQNIPTSTYGQSSEDHANTCGSGCSVYAECISGICSCRNGWTGDGFECTYNCEVDFIWSVDKCVPVTDQSDDDKSN